MDGLARANVSPWAASRSLHRHFSVWHPWNSLKSWKVIQTVCGMWRGHQRVLTYLVRARGLQETVLVVVEIF